MAIGVKERPQGVRELVAARRDFDKDGGDSWAVRDGERALLGQEISRQEVLEMVNAPI